MITHLIDFFINFSLASFLKVLWKPLFGCWGFLWFLSSKESICILGDLLLIPGLGRSPGEGNIYPLQYSCLENSMKRGAWWAPVHGVARVGEDLATKPPPYFLISYKCLYYCQIQHISLIACLCLPMCSIQIISCPHYFATLISQFSRKLPRFSFVVF